MKKRLVITLLIAVLTGCASVSEIGKPADERVCKENYSISYLQYVDFVDVNLDINTMEFDIIDVVERHHGKRLDEMRVYSMKVIFTYVSKGDCTIKHIERRSLYGGMSKTVTLPYIPETYIYWNWSFMYRE